MYKVFIDNKPINFQINSQFDRTFDRELIWQKIKSFLNSAENSLTIDLNHYSEFDAVFSEHKKVAAAGGLVQKNDTYLFIKRNGFWDIPKGKLEKGESVEDGAIREVEEECGIKRPIILRHLIDTYHTYPHKGKHVLKRTYWFLMAEKTEDYELIPQHEEGITEVRFFKKEEFNIIKAKTYNSIIDVIEALN